MTACTYTDHAHDGRAVLNLFWILIINIVAICCVTTWLCGTGMPLGQALLAGWFGGAALSCVVVTALVNLMLVLTPAEPARA